jgi:NrS-1  polymerase HBD domain
MAERFDPRMAELIPEELRSLPQWVCWRFESKGDRITKVPVRAGLLSRRASSTNPADWASFERALATFEAHQETTANDGTRPTPRRHVDGIGFVFTADDNCFGIDLDDCLTDEGELVPEAAEIVDSFNSYTEISPSGRGVKIFARGKFTHPQTGKQGGRSKKIDGFKETEIYSANRFFTVTASTLPGSSRSVSDRQAQLDELSARLWPKRKGATSPRSEAAEGEVSMSDAELLGRARGAKNGAKFRALFDEGDLSDYQGDRSAGDFALCRMLAFWTFGDPSRIDRLFRESALIRGKWRREGYRTSTIQKAIDACNGEFFRERASDARPRIQFSSKNLGDVVRQLDAIIGSLDPPILFQRASCLVRIIGEKFIIESTEAGFETRRVLEEGESRPEGAECGERLVIKPIRVAPLKALTSEAVVFEKFVKGEWVDGVVPLDVVKALHEQEDWNRIPVLEGISTLPLLRHDGTILCKPGYDLATGIFLTGDLEIQVPEAPTREDAKDAAAFLSHNLFADFPFKDECDRAAAFAGLLSLAVRPSLRAERNECVPAFVMTAPVRGSGKSLLAKVMNLAILGDLPSVTQPPRDKDEWRKTLFALALEGASSVLWDNVEAGTSFGSPSLDMVLTGGFIQDRILGISRVGRARLSAVHFATGNNFRIKGDLARRVIWIRQDAQCARPEQRGDFQHPDILGWIEANRRELLTAVFTILRAHALAGRPAEGTKRLGGFERWDDLVRSCVLWLGFDDPCASMDEFMEAADDDVERREVVEALEENFADEEFTSREVHAVAMSGEEIEVTPGPRPRLQPASRLFQALRPDSGRKLTPVGVGKKLSSLVEAPAGELVLRKRDDEIENLAKWRIEPWTDGTKGERDSPPF